MEPIVAPMTAEALASYLPHQLHDFLGIPVRVNPRTKLISYSAWPWPAKRIIVGPQWFMLDPRTRAAILLHEAGHCKLFHLEKRLASLWRLAWSPKSLLALCVEQELEADTYAAERGYGAELIMLYSTLTEQESIYHPSVAERCKRIRAVMQATGA